MIQQWHPLDAPRTNEPAPEPTQAQQASRERYARLLYQNAANATSWRMADRLAQSWGLSHEALGIAPPDEQLR